MIFFICSELRSGLGSLLILTTSYPFSDCCDQMCAFTVQFLLTNASTISNHSPQCNIVLCINLKIELYIEKKCFIVVVNKHNLCGNNN